MIDATQAIVLAAERYRPAPAGSALPLMLGGCSVLARVRDRLYAGGVKKIAVDESGLLPETLIEKPAFLVNPDCVWLDGPLPALRRLAAVDGENIDGVMLVHRTFQVTAELGPGDFFLDSWGVPRRRVAPQIAPYFYAGVTLAKPALLQRWHFGAVPLHQALDEAIEAGRLRAVVHDGLWFHLAGPEDFEEAEHALAAQLTGPTT